MNTLEQVKMWPATKPFETNIITWDKFGFAFKQFLGEDCNGNCWLTI